MTEQAGPKRSPGSVGAYKELRATVEGEAGRAWDSADRGLAELRASYERLREDPRYTEEHKSEQAWELYARASEKIVANRERARSLLEQQAKTDRRFSIPLPPEQSVTVTDPATLLACQNEHTRIIRKLDRLEANARGPSKRSPVEVLQEEYSKGLEAGGVQGGSICRGVLSAADELGIDAASVVDQYRNDRHRANLERAQASARLTDLFSKQGPPEPPFPGQEPVVGRGGSAIHAPPTPSSSPGTARRWSRAGGALGRSQRGPSTLVGSLCPRVR
jgi:hypothetical protein